MSLLLGKTHWNVYRKRNVSLIRFCIVLGKCVHVYTYADICMFVLYIIIQMQRGRKKIISNSWWIWAKHIWKYDVGSGICFCGSMLKRRQRLFWAIHAPVHRVPSCFLSSCCDVLLLKDSLFFSSQSPYFPEVAHFSRNLHMPVVEWWADRLGGSFWGAGQGGRATVTHCGVRDTGGTGTREYSLGWAVLETTIWHQDLAPPLLCFYLASVFSTADTT